MIKQKKYKEAEAKYSEALNLDPYNKKLNSIIYSNRALCFMKTGDKIKALQDLNKSLELDPNYMKSLVRRAELNMDREEYTAAIHDYGKIQELDPSVNLKGKIDEAKKKEKQAKKKDYYAILGVSKSASVDEIKKAYKKLAMQYHPDRNRSKSDIEQQEAAKKFKDIAEAHGVLTDAEKKKKYDCGQMEFDGDTDFSDMGGNMNFGNMGGNGSTRMYFNGQDMSGMGGDPSQIFSMFFNQGGMGGMGGMADDDFAGFGSFGKRGGSKKPRNGSNKGTGNSQANGQTNGFGGFPGFGSFGGFGQKNANFNFA